MPTPAQADDRPRPRACLARAQITYTPAMVRVSWDRYFMNLAVQAATRSTCPRKAVGAVVVRDKAVLATGYNGSIRGLEHCFEVGCLMDNDHCVRTVHAEANAILQAARHGMRIEGADIYVTASPCWDCFKLIANAGIGRVLYGEFYRDERIQTFAQQAGIELVPLGLEG
jgi:dCMP deaminase